MKFIKISEKQFMDRIHQLNVIKQEGVNVIKPPKPRKFSNVSKVDVNLTK